MLLRGISDLLQFVWVSWSVVLNDSKVAHKSWESNRKFSTAPETRSTERKENKTQICDVFAQGFSTSSGHLFFRIMSWQWWQHQLRAPHHELCASVKGIDRKAYQLRRDKIDKNARDKTCES